MLDEARRQQLAREIEMIFAENIYPDHDYEVGDPDEIKWFLGKDWRDLSPDFVFRYCYNMGFFSPKGYCYFLPAFFLAWLKDPVGADNADLSWHLIHVLQPGDPHDERFYEWRLRNPDELVGCLTSAQRAVIRKIIDAWEELSEPGVNKDSALDDLRLFWWNVTVDRETWHRIHLMDAIRREQLASEIEAAFTDVPYPGEAIGDMDEREVRAFVGKERNELTPEFVNRNRDALFFFWDQAWHYYLPSFMTTLLRAPEETDVLDLTVWINLSFRDDQTRHRLKRKASLLSPEQRAVVRKFVDSFDEIAEDFNTFSDDARLFWWDVE